MKRLSHLLLLVAIMLVGASSLHAQTVDDVLDKYFKKTGGLKSWKKIKSMRATAKMSIQGQEIPLIISQKYPDKQRIEMDAQGQKFVQAYNGSEAWTINPFEGGTEPRKLTGEELKEIEDQMTVESPFIDYKKKGHTVELEGTETVNGEEYHKVKLSKKNGTVHYYLFHKENSIPVIMRRPILAGPMKGQTGESHLSDFKPVGDIILPYVFENKLNGQTFIQFKIERYERDTQIDDAIFEFPTK